MDKNAYIDEIENEYRKIDANWLKLHYKTAVGLVLFAAVVECVLGAVLYSTGVVSLVVGQYVARYILVPLLLNSLLVGIWILVARLKAPSKTAKAFLISQIFVAICFVLYSVHHIFPSLYLIFIVPVLLTVVYGNYLLTIVTSAFSITMKIVSDLFIAWDPEITKQYSDQYTLMDFIISICILCAFCAVCLVVIYFGRAKNNAVLLKEIERYQLKIRLRTDELTGICNKVALREAFQAMEDDDTGNSYILAMIDLDNFKLFNDTLGHDAGDQVLKAFGRILSDNCGDMPSFRFGGDEFCILFKNRPLNDVLETCRSIQEGYMAHAETVSEELPITISIGVARFSPNMTTTQLLNNTDDALYRSKQAKNIISVFES